MFKFDNVLCTIENLYRISPFWCNVNINEEHILIIFKGSEYDKIVNYFKTESGGSFYKLQLTCEHVKFWTPNNLFIIDKNVINWIEGGSLTLQFSTKGEK